MEDSLDFSRSRYVLRRRAIAWVGLAPPVGMAADPVLDEWERERVSFRVLTWVAHRIRIARSTR